MPVITCPVCNKRYKVEAPKSGKKVRCKCGVRFDSVSATPECKAAGSKPEIPPPKNASTYKSLLPPPPPQQKAKVRRFAVQQDPVVTCLLPPIPCAECGHTISCEAVTCPSCGGPNKWVHPAIAKFLASRGRFENIRPFEVHVLNYVLVVVDAESRQNSETLSALIGSVRIWAPLSLHGLLTVGATHFAGKGLQEWLATNVKMFRIDFSTRPVSYACNDADHWSDVLEFFGLT